jgi:hypothetical protein
MEPQLPPPARTARRMILAAPFVAALAVGGASPAKALTAGEDASTATLLADPNSLSRAALSAAIGDETGVTASDPAHTTKIIPRAGKSGLFIRNEQPKYALKIDQYDTNGVYDAVDIVALFGGAHTAVGVSAKNTTRSTVKVTNSAAQTGGSVIAAVGEDPARTASIINADNFGTGPSFAASAKGGNSIAYRAAYDPGAYSNSIVWATGHHIGGNLLCIENDGAHRSGSMVRLIESNPATTTPMVYIQNAGNGESITAPSFNVLKDGRVKLKQIENSSSFNNSQVQMLATGTVINRNVADAHPAMKIQNNNASSTGDILQILRDTGEVVSRFNKRGYFTTRGVVAPPSAADLGNNEMTLWFDPVAAQLRLLAKDSSGVVKTGTVRLS